jgi:hypothetical protein
MLKHKNDPERIYSITKEEIEALRQCRPKTKLLEENSGTKMLLEELHMLRQEVKSLKEKPATEKMQVNNLEAEEPQPKPQAVYNIKVMNGRRGNTNFNQRRTFPKSFCQYCKKSNHNTEDCFYIKNLTKVCKKCNKTGHHTNECREPICFNCKQPGHKQAECRKRKFDQLEEPSYHRNYRYRNVGDNKQNNFYEQSTRNPDEEKDNFVPMSFMRHQPEEISTKNRTIEEEDLDNPTYFSCYAEYEEYRKSKKESRDKIIMVSKQENEEKETGILKVNLGIEGIRKTSLIDSGANCNTIDEHTLKEIMPQAEIKKKKLTKIKGFDRGKVDVIGSITLEVNFNSKEELNEEMKKEDREQNLREDIPAINDRTIRKFLNETYLPPKDCIKKKGEENNSAKFLIEFLVVRNVEIPIIIGWPTMNKMDMIINCLDKTIQIADTIINYQSNINKQIHTAKEITIQPNSEARVKIKNNNLNPLEMYLVKETSKQIYTPTEGVIDYNTNYIYIKNITKHKILIPENCPIVTVTVVKKEDTRNQTKEEKEAEKEHLTEIKKRIFKSNLSIIEKEELWEEIKTYKNFSGSLDYKNIKHNYPEQKIRLHKGSRPVVEAMARNHPEKHLLINQHVEDLLKRDLIEKGDGSWRSRVLMVRKPNGTWRTTIDYRKLNEKVLPDQYPLPRIDEILDNLQGAKYFSKIDCTDGFYHIRLDEKSKNYTGFATQTGLWRWKVLPMGLRCSPAIYQRFMDHVLGDSKWKFAMVYIDDIIIYSKTWREHLEHIKIVMGKLQEWGVIIKPNKCEFGVDKIDFLGFVVSKNGVEVNKEKTNAITNLPVPKDKKAVQRFLGMAGFYRRFIKNFSSKTLNLRKQTLENVEFNWNDECHKEFNNIKQELISPEVMAYPNFNKIFTIETDASYSGLGAVLSQEGRPIAYASRSLNEHEKHYGVTKLEALGVVWAVDKFKVYLQQRKFELITDHKALVKFKEMKDTNPMLERWSIKLSEYDYNVTHRAGKNHSNVDCLSRDVLETLVANFIVNVGEMETEEKNKKYTWEEMKEKIIQLQKEDDHLKIIFNAMMKKGIGKLNAKTKQIEEIVYEDKNKQIWVQKKDMKLYKRIIQNSQIIDKLCIPKIMVPYILASAHDSNHFDYKRTYEKIKERFFWLTLTKDTKKFCQSCLHCQYRKNSKGYANKSLLQSIEVREKFELIGIDLFKPGPTSRRGYEYVLVITDYATKYTMIVPVTDKKATTIATALFENWITNFGCPKRLISDNGGEFTAEEFEKSLIQLLKIKHHRTTSYHPRCNGQVERFNRVMADMLAKRLEGKLQIEWDQYLSAIQLEYNITKHSVTREAPYYLMFGQEPRLPMDELLEDLDERMLKKRGYDVKKWREEGLLDMKERLKGAVEKIRKRQKQNEERANKGKEERKFKVGDEVMIRFEPVTNKDIHRHKKLINPWLGPFKIIESKSASKNVYEVRIDEEKTELVNIKNMKIFYRRPDWMNIQAEKITEDLFYQPEINKEDIKDLDYIPEEARNQKITKQQPIEKMETRKNPQRHAWTPKILDQVDVKFKVKKGKEFWYCGQIKNIKEGKAFIEFLDGGDAGWYDLEEYIQEKEIKLCKESKRHQRDAKPKVLLMEKMEIRAKKNERYYNRKKRILESGGLDHISNSQEFQSAARSMFLKPKLVQVKGLNELKNVAELEQLGEIDFDEKTIGKIAEKWNLEKRFKCIGAITSAQFK